MQSLRGIFNFELMMTGNTKRRTILMFFCLLGLFACNRRTPLFEKIPSGKSGVYFNNKITESDSVNELDIENVYNGGGVGIGDFNNDGLQDIYLTGNMVENKLYLNRGKFHFDDVTPEADVAGEGKWCRGVAVVDINNDGWMDIYICATLNKNPEKRKNILYINQGLDKNGIPHFKDMAKEYGLDDSAQSTQAAFFDYDNDGDLDVYVVTNEINRVKFPDIFRPVVKGGVNPSTGHLYRNDWNDSLKHPVFTDVSKQAGIQTEGYGHSVNIVDINNDGWKDIYVTNDFITNDLLWINNHDGTFTEQLSAYFKHTSANAMGQDIEDMNNDGLPDVFVLDMNPEGNYRKKTMMGSNNYRVYQNNDQFGFNYQYVRNTLQLNQGPGLGKNNDSIIHPVFSDISFYAGVSQTDWSWTPMIVDFDNDGYRDLVITNGFPKDITDHDFGVFRNQAIAFASKQTLLSQIPVVKIPNYAYRNNGDLSFTDKTLEWGLETPTFSNGAAYADFDNDGAMDMVINNIDDEAEIYRNTSRDKQKENNHFLNVKFAGSSKNRNGLGAMIALYYDSNKIQTYENTPFRGYLSTIQAEAHFGLGSVKMLDSLHVKWPDGSEQTLIKINVDQTVLLNIKDAKYRQEIRKQTIDSSSLFKNITGASGIQFTHQQTDFIDFDIQKLLPHKLSEYGPAIAVGDVDGNGMDDFVVGAAPGHAVQIFLQQADGHFIQRPLDHSPDTAMKKGNDQGLLLFDADGDGDLDLFIARGGYASAPDNIAYNDQFYINDGRGNFTVDTTAIPKNLTSKLCVRAADFDHDGDLDLFISGRVIPGHYPQAVNSFIYRNDSKDGHVKFTDVTTQVAKELNSVGMVCDALFTDFNNDGWPDLVLAGEWMPVSFFENDKGVFKNVTSTTGISNVTGWWNSITAGDFDNDGDMDYIVGNLGLNSFYKASAERPVRAYGKDFDKNGIYDMIPSTYLKDQNNEWKEFPAEGRDDMLKQLNMLRKKFPSYKEYAVATMDQVLTTEDRKDALIVQANEFRSMMLRNDGNGKFTMIPLPLPAQYSVINGMVAEDFDGDGNLDLAMNGNDYGSQPLMGRYDAFNGLVMLGDGKGNFKPQSILQSGIYIPGNGKALVEIMGANGRAMIAASQNRADLKLFSLRQSELLTRVQTRATDFRLNLRNGKQRKQESYYGSSFLSQSGRYIHKTAAVTSVEQKDPSGKWVPISTP
jgi:ASPIC and UnbV/FG-GAP-like repeat